MATILTATTTFPNLCNLSRDMTNSVDRHDQHRDDVVYMAIHSFGGREWNAGEHVHFVDDFHNEGWLGFAEEDATRFMWESASSGAIIEAVRNSEGSWKLTFVGTDKVGREESLYVFDFAQAANLNELRIEHVEEGLLDQLENWVEVARDRDDECRPRFEVVRRVENFAMLVANFAEIDARLEEDEQLEFEHGSRWS